MNARIFNDYEQAFTRRAHQLLFWGYQQARNRFNEGIEEDDISQYIFEKIVDILEWSDKLPEEYHRFDVHNEAPSRDGGRTGRRRKKIDILLVDCNTRQPRYKLCCEAKRLSTSGGFNIKKYTDDGMMRFIREEYAAEYSFASMLGYIQTNDANYWYSELKKRLADLESTDIQVTTPLTECQIITDIPQEWKSEHGRITRSSILLYHIFFDCS